MIFFHGQRWLRPVTLLDVYMVHNRQFGDQVLGVYGVHFWIEIYVILR
jgi:hypothetical protein